MLASISQGNGCNQLAQLMYSCSPYSTVTIELLPHSTIDTTSVRHAQGGNEAFAEGSGLCEEGRSGWQSSPLFNGGEVHPKSAIHVDELNSEFPLRSFILKEVAYR
jgi:hypothetical protein